MTTNIETQSDLWNGASGERWVREQERLDRALAGVDRIALEAAAAAKGERVVDVGCGCGASTIALAERVGESGSVLGLDLSAPMLARAKERTASLPWVELALGDAARHPFRGDADLLYSRFGVMFFDVPRDAFAHLKNALSKGGRVCFATWRAPEENPWLVLPLRAAERVLPPIPPPPAGGPGPFSLADEGVARQLFEDAGFSDVKIVPHDLYIPLSTTGLDEAVDFALTAGPAARRIEAVDEATRVRVRESVSQALSEHLEGTSVDLPAAIWTVQAIRR